MRSPAIPLAVLVALGAAVGCTGVIAGDATDPSPNNSTSTTEAACTALVPVAPLRRLTREQYDHTINDLLGIEGSAGAAFSPDDDLDGFAVAGTVSPLLAEQQVQAAESVALQVAARVTAGKSKVVSCDPANADCVDTFIRSFARRAFRGRVADAELSKMRSLFDLGRKDGTFADGVRLVVEFALLSPRFHYLGDVSVTAGAEGSVVALDGAAIASRLSYFLWDTMPDDELLAAAERDALRTPEQVEAQARRLIASPRANETIASFHRQWLQLDRLDGIARDTTMHPEWKPELRKSMKESLEMFVNDAALSGPGGLSRMLEGSHAFVDGPLATLLGVPGVTGAGFVRVELDPAQRKGLITQPALLALYAKPLGSDPIHRGVFVRKQLFCQDMPPPPPDVAFDVEEPKPGLTTRERFAAHTKNEACASCHRLIDGVGFGLENYDALGRYRTQDQGVAIDASGEVVSTEDMDGNFNGGTELAAKIGKSREVQRCVAKKWMTFALSRPVTALDKCGVDGLSQALTNSNGDIRELMIAITKLPAFRSAKIASTNEVSP